MMPLPGGSTLLLQTGGSTSSRASRRARGPRSRDRADTARNPPTCPRGTHLPRTCTGHVTKTGQTRLRGRSLHRDMIGTITQARYVDHESTMRERPMITLTINGTSHEVDVEPETPLLWVIRDTIGLTGTKFGCGIAQCGACTVHLNGEAMRSCSVAVSDAVGAEIVTIEGLSPDSSHAVQRAWLAEDVPQCGWCQSGQIMAAASLLQRKQKPTDADIDEITNICRCGTYARIRRAIHRAAQNLVSK